MSYLLDYIEDGTFPSKQIWKSIVYSAVDSIQLNNWLNRVISDDSFTRFRNIHTSVTITEFWKHSNSFNEIKNSFLITKLLTEIPNTTSNICDICTRNFKDVYVHACCNCPSTNAQREVWWDILSDNFPVQLYCELNMYDDEILFQMLLGRKPLTIFSSIDESVQFLKLCHAHVIQCVAEYSRSLRQCY